MSGVGGWVTRVGCVGVDDSSAYPESPRLFLAFLFSPYTHRLSSSFAVMAEQPLLVSGKRI